MLNFMFGFMEITHDTLQLKKMKFGTVKIVGMPTSFI